MHSSRNPIPVTGDRLLDSKQVAEITGIKVGTLARARITGAPAPPWCKIGASVRYKMSSLQHWISRTSPFFPLSPREMKERKYIKGLIIVTNSWGEVKFFGEQLSVDDETVLMATLSLISKAENRQITDVAGEKTFTYTGPMLPIVRAKCIKGKVGTSQYSNILESYKRMTGARIELSTYKFNKKGERVKSTVKFNNIISGGEYSPGSHTVCVTVNPFFYESLLAANVVLLDMEARSELCSPIPPFQMCIHMRPVMHHNQIHNCRQKFRIFPFHRGRSCQCRTYQCLCHCLHRLPCHTNKKNETLDSPQSRSSHKKHGK